MQHLELQPHIKLGSQHAKAACIVVGDPARATQIAETCEKSTQLAFNREYKSFSCTHQGVEFLVCSHGVGSAGAAIAIMELIKIGVKLIIRAGSAGSLQVDKVKTGDLVIGYGFAKEDGVTSLTEPMGMPAMSDFYVTSALLESAKELGLAGSAKAGEKSEGPGVLLGIGVSTDLFYAPTVFKSQLEVWVKTQAMFVEMEGSAISMLCRLHGVLFGAIFYIDGTPLNFSENYDPEGIKCLVAKKNMINIVLKTLTKADQLLHRATA